MPHVVPNEEFLHAKTNSKDIYVDYGATEDIQKMHAVYGSMDGELTALN